MAEQDESDTAKVLRGVVAGAIAGAVASFAMDRFQAVVTALTSSEDGGDEQSEPATEQAADAIARQVAGREVADADKPLAGQAIHYALGVGLGIAYGIAAEFRPALTAGYGTGFGVTTATLLDEAAVPAMGLGSAPWHTDLSTNLYSYASHLVFGATSELVRRQVADTLRA
jgi:putative membrane protein